VEVELKEELDAFVLASLAEYAKLFLQPGANVRTRKSGIAFLRLRQLFCLGCVVLSGA